jgi:uncharacterized membrane protein YfcA
MESIENFTLIGLTFLLAGFVKGVIGLGLPTISLALLTTGFGLLPAMGIMIIPSLVTNFWQAVQGGALLKIAKRFWVLMLAVVAGIWIGGKILLTSDMIFLTGLLGILLCIYSLIGLTRYKISAPGKSEFILSPLVGGISGILTGLTGTFVIPGVLYLQSIGLDRNILIQTMGVLFSVSTLALAITLGHNNLFSLNMGAYSLGGIAPAIIGMIIGQKVRSKLSEKIFTRVFFTSLLLLGFYITGRTLI